MNVLIIKNAAAEGPGTIEDHLVDIATFRTRSSSRTEEVPPRTWIDTAMS